jgi:hypothetical protein
MVGDHMGIPRTVVFVSFVIGFSHRLPACLRHTYHRRMSLVSVVRDAVGGGYICVRSPGVLILINIHPFGPLKTTKNFSIRSSDKQ